MLLWDFDGTLANTWESGQEIYNEIARRHRFSPMTDPEAARRMSTREFLRHHRIPLLKIPLVMREWHAALRSRMSAVPLFPGIHDMLIALHQTGRALGILSSNQEENIRLCLRSRNVEGLFDFVISYPRLFGKASGIRRVLRKHGLARSELLYVGDEVRDIEAARKAGVDSVAVGWGLNPPEMLRQASPTHLIERADELPGLLDRAGANQVRAMP
jgi:phosphoglycolate phosphatase